MQLSGETECNFLPYTVTCLADVLAFAAWVSKTVYLLIINNKAWRLHRFVPIYKKCSSSFINKINKKDRFVFNYFYC